MEKYEIIENLKTYEIQKRNKTTLSIKELKELLEMLIIEGKGDYEVYHEGFCCAVEGVNISKIHKTISLD